MTDTVEDEEVFLTPLDVWMLDVLARRGRLQPAARGSGEILERFVDLGLVVEVETSERIPPRNAAALLAAGHGLVNDGVPVVLYEITDEGRDVLAQIKAVPA